MFELHPSTPAEVVEGLPIFIGYIPQEHLVVSVQKDEQVIATAVFALEALADLPAQVWSLTTLVRRGAADHALAVVYSATPEAYSEAATTLMEATGLPGMLLAATDTAWARIHEGTPGAYLPREPHSDPVLAAVVAGLQLPSATRDELADRYRPQPHRVEYLHDAGAQEWNGERLADIIAPMQEWGGLDAHGARSIAAALLAPEVWGALLEDLGSGQARSLLPVLAEAVTYYDDAPSTLRIEEEAERVLVAAGLCAWLATDSVAHATICQRLAERSAAGCLDFEGAMVMRFLVIATHMEGIDPRAWLTRRNDAD